MSPPARWSCVCSWSSRRRGGLRLGGRLVDALLQHAGQVGASAVRLWTAAGLDAARALYLSRGFRLVGEEPHERWGRPLVSQEYVRQQAD